MAVETLFPPVPARSSAGHVTVACMCESLFDGEITTSRLLRSDPGAIDLRLTLTTLECVYRRMKVAEI